LSYGFNYLPLDATRALVLEIPFRSQPLVTLAPRRSRWGDNAFTDDVLLLRTWQSTAWNNSSRSS